MKSLHCTLQHLSIISLGYLTSIELAEHRLSLASLPILPSVLFSLASLQLPGNIRLDLKKLYKEPRLNVGRPSRELLQASGQRCWWPKFSYKLWRLNWKYLDDIKEPEMSLLAMGWKGED